MHSKDMEWSDKHDITLCREFLVMELCQYPYRSKCVDHPRFKVNKRSVRDRLTFLITKYKAKVREEENVSRISCKESELDQALEKIVEKEKLADEKSSETKSKEKEGKTAGKEHRKIAMERLSQTKKRKAESETSGSHAKKAEGAPLI